MFDNPEFDVRVHSFLARCVQYNIGRGDMPDDAGRVIPLPVIFCKGKVHSICACLAGNYMEPQVTAAVVDYCPKLASMPACCLQKCLLLACLSHWHSEMMPYIITTMNSGTCMCDACLHDRALLVKF
jgi:hypothetical protein